MINKTINLVLFCIQLVYIEIKKIVIHPYFKAEDNLFKKQPNEVKRKELHRKCESRV